MFANLGQLYQELKGLTEKRVSILIMLVLLGVNQLIYTYVPGAFFLNLLLLGGLLHLFNVRFDLHYTRHLVVVGLFIVASYLFMVFSYWEFLTYSLYSLILLWIFMNALFYLFGDELSTGSLLGGLSRFRTAAVYFGILYAVIYLISYLFNQIFFLELPYDGMVFRIANSLSTVAGLLVLFTAKVKLTLGSFSELLFGKILPKLSLVFGVLAVIYSVQVLFGFLRAYPPIVFYGLAGLFYLAFVLHPKKEEKQWERKGLLLLFIVLSFLYILIRLNVSGKVSGLYEGRSFYHEILLLVSFCLLNVYLFFKEKGELWGLKWFSFLVVLVLFLPPFGIMVHEEYSLNEAAKIANKNVFTEFKEKKQRPSYVEENLGVRYFYSSEDRMEMDIGGYAHLVELQWHNDNAMQGYSRGETSLQMDPDRKRLRIGVGEKESVLNLYEEANKKDPSERWTWEVHGVRIVIKHYSYSEEYFDLNFSALFKE